MELVADLADHVTVLDFGQTLATGPPDAVLRDPRVAEAYLGRLGEHPPDEPAGRRGPTAKPT